MLYYCARLRSLGKSLNVNRADFNEGLLVWIQSASLLGFAKGPIPYCQCRFSGQMTIYMPQLLFRYLGSGNIGKMFTRSCWHENGSGAEISSVGVWLPPPGSLHNYPDGSTARRVPIAGTRG